MAEFGNITSGWERVHRLFQEVHGAVGNLFRRQKVVLDFGTDAHNVAIDQTVGDRDEPNLDYHGNVVFGIDDGRVGAVDDQVVGVDHHGNVVFDIGDGEGSSPHDQNEEPPEDVGCKLETVMALERERVLLETTIKLGEFNFKRRGTLFVAMLNSPGKMLLGAALGALMVLSVYANGISFQKDLFKDSPWYLSAMVAGVLFLAMLSFGRKLKTYAERKQHGMMLLFLTIWTAALILSAHISYGYWLQAGGMDTRFGKQQLETTISPLIATLETLENTSTALEQSSQEAGDHARDMFIQEEQQGGTCDGDRTPAKGPRYHFRKQQSGAFDSFRNSVVTHHQSTRNENTKGGDTLIERLEGWKQSEPGKVPVAKIRFEMEQALAKARTFHAATSTRFYGADKHAGLNTIYRRDYNHVQFKGRSIEVSCFDPSIVAHLDSIDTQLTLLEGAIKDAETTLKSHRLYDPNKIGALTQRAFELTSELLDKGREADIAVDELIAMLISYAVDILALIFSIALPSPNGQLSILLASSSRLRERDGLLGIKRQGDRLFMRLEHDSDLHRYLETLLAAVEFRGTKRIGELFEHNDGFEGFLDRIALMNAGWFSKITEGEVLFIFSADEETLEILFNHLLVEAPAPPEI